MYDFLRLLISNGIIYLLSKLCELYLKRPLALTNIDIDYVNEEATLNDADSMCLLFSSPSLLRARAVSFPSIFYLVLHSFDRCFVHLFGSSG